jgi:hypothetical protein
VSAELAKLRLGSVCDSFLTPATGLRLLVRLSNDPSWEVQLECISRIGALGQSTPLPSGWRVASSTEAVDALVAMLAVDSVWTGPEIPSVSNEPGDAIFATLGTIRNLAAGRLSIITTPYVCESLKRALAAPADAETRIAQVMVLSLAAKHTSDATAMLKPFLTGDDAALALAATPAIAYERAGENPNMERRELMALAQTHRDPVVRARANRRIAGGWFTLRMQGSPFGPGDIDRVRIAMRDPDATTAALARAALIR